MWATLTETDWNRVAIEPGDNRDLGPLAPARLALLRLTEVEVHGADLDVGLDDWSPQFVDAALPFRIERFRGRRPAEATRDGSWLLVSTDGPAFLLSVRGTEVTAEPADATTASGLATATITASSRDLVALLLGRPLSRHLELSGDTVFAAAFRRAFPGP